MNLNAFRVFLTVYDKRSMTLAAHELHLTQSGISQHIKALEADLGFALFERVGKKLFPTAVAADLYERGKKGFADVEAAILSASQTEPKPQGVVKIGLPVEYGTNVILPHFARLGEEYPDLDFAISLDFATVLSQMVLKGELHFAMIDGFRVDPALRTEPIAEETFQLCGLKSYVKKFGAVRYNSKYFSQLNYVDYREGEPVVRNWFRHHLHRQNLDIRVRARVLDVQGVSKFILSGLAVGVLPDHVVTRLQKDGADLFVYESARAPLKNQMCLVQLPLKKRPLAQQVVIDCLRKIAVGKIT